MMKSEQLKKDAIFPTHEGIKYLFTADDLNALIEAVIAEKMKDMYPKEFVEWAIQFTKLWDIGNEKAYTFQTKEGDINTLTLDELYQYWKENER